MISYVTLCRGFGCELKKVRKMRLGPTCQGLLSQEVAFQAKWEKDLFVLAAAETSQTWTFYTQRRLLTDTGLPQRLKAVLALKYTCLLLFWSSFPPRPLRDMSQYAREGQYLHLSLTSKYKVVWGSYTICKTGIYSGQSGCSFRRSSRALCYYHLNCELD